MTINEYLDWLKSLVGDLGNQYQSLLEIAFSIEFFDIVPNDENRVVDGLQLRYDFEQLRNGRTDMHKPCTMLEMIIGLARRMNNDVLYDFENPDNTNAWFWVMIDNLNLMSYSDDVVDNVIIENRIKNVFMGVVNRSYQPNGRGGLFPLKRAKQNQKMVELWYQMQSWVSENL